MHTAATNAFPPPTRGWIHSRVARWKSADAVEKEDDAELPSSQDFTGSGWGRARWGLLRSLVTSSVRVFCFFSFVLLRVFFLFCVCFFSVFCSVFFCFF